MVSAKNEKSPVRYFKKRINSIFMMMMMMMMMMNDDDDVVYIYIMIFMCLLFQMSFVKVQGKSYCRRTCRAFFPPPPATSGSEAITPKSGRIT